jgi:L-cysteine S-thiosulfotransferase
VPDRAGRPFAAAIAVSAMLAAAAAGAQGPVGSVGGTGTAAAPADPHPDAPAAGGPVAGDASAGAEIAASRRTGLCVLCHALPGVPAALAGTIGPDLAGVGARLTRARLREQLVAPERFNPGSVMPSVSRTDGLARVAPARAGRPLLDARQLEDLLAYLETLR